MPKDDDGRDLERYTTTVRLLDGTSMKLRAIRCDDTTRLLDFVKGLSPHSRYLRFHHYVSGLTKEEATRFCNVDYRDSMALVAVVTENGQENIIAVGRCYRYPRTDRAEVAFAVADKYQGKGIGTGLLDMLELFASENSVRLIEALVLDENEEMKEVFQHRGFRVVDYLGDGVIKMALDMKPDE
jgi:GNAT superfamily N-acetyltransferase